MSIILIWCYQIPSKNMITRVFVVRRSPLFWVWWLPNKKSPRIGFESHWLFDSFVGIHIWLNGHGYLGNNGSTRPGIEFHLEPILFLCGEILGASFRFPFMRLVCGCDWDPLIWPMQGDIPMFLLAKEPHDEEGLASCTNHQPLSLISIQGLTLSWCGSSTGNIFIRSFWNLEQMRYFIKDVRGWNRMQS